MAGKSLQSIAALLVGIGDRRAGAAAGAGAGAAVVVIIRVHSNPLGLGFRVQPILSHRLCNCSKKFSVA